MPRIDTANPRKPNVNKELVRKGHDPQQQQQTCLNPFFLPTYLMLHMNAQTINICKLQASRFQGINKMTRCKKNRIQSETDELEACMPGGTLHGSQQVRVATQAALGIPFAVISPEPHRHAGRKFDAYDDCVASWFKEGRGSSGGTNLTEASPDPCG